MSNVARLCQTNPSRLSQLERDARKKGNYQAKLAWAKFQIDEKNPDAAKPLLLEIINDKKNHYVHEANKLLKKIDPISSAIDDIASLAHVYFSKDNQKQRIYPSSASFLTPIVTGEIFYKMLRYAYENQITTMDDKRYLAELEKLLERHKDVTDSVRNKITMQRIRVFLKMALDRNSMSDLKEADRLCLELMNDPDLEDTKKAEWARVIHQKIDECLKKSSVNFTFPDHVKSHVSVGMEVSRMFGKYLFLVIGNLLDFALLFLSKMGSKQGEAGPRWGKDAKDHNGFYTFFKNAGAAMGFKFVGKYVGKWFFGLLVGAPIAFIASLFSYPFRALTEAVSEQSKNISATVDEIFKIKVTKKLSSEEEVDKLIFERKESRSIQVVNYDSSNLSQAISASDAEGLSMKRVTATDFGVASGRENGKAAYFEFFGGKISSCASERDQMKLTELLTVPSASSSGV